MYINGCNIRVLNTQFSIVKYVFGSAYEREPSHPHLIDCSEARFKKGPMKIPVSQLPTIACNLKPSNSSHRTAKTPNFLSSARIRKVETHLGISRDT